MLRPLSRMNNINKVFGSLRFSILLSSRILQTPGILRNSSNHSKLPEKLNNSQISEKVKQDEFLVFRDPVSQGLISKYWNESKAVKHFVKQNTFPRNVTNIIDLINSLVSIRKNFPGTIESFAHWLERSREKRALIEQQFLPQRHAVLKPDLAAAHFLVRRGGSIKFVGQKHWLGIKEKKTALPNTFVPGLYIEAIELERSNLYYEGLKNICSLSYLKSLSLKNLEHVDDWWLDWISSEYYLNLKHLDLTNCKNVTYRGLSCFYRFESLETLNVEGVPDPPEFKLACTMLLDIIPELNITGIDLSLPDEITAVEIKEDEISPKGS